MAMTKEHKDILQRNHLMLLEKLILSEELINDEFIAELVADGILTTSLLETIQVKKTRTDQVRELLFTLTRRGDRAYVGFLKGLIESRQDHLANCLDPVTAEKFIKERDQRERERPSPAQVEVQSSFDIRWQPSDCAVDEMDTVWYDKLFVTDTKELGVELKPMPRDRQKRISEMMNSKKAYPLTKKDGCFGRAVIVNNMHYLCLEPRPGSDVDCEQLKKLFEQLHFEPVVHKDLTAEDMQKILMDERNNPKHDEYSSFVLCILAHGSENKVYGIDGYENSGAIDIREITSLFSTVNCPGLAGKPKLFFIQACQGGKDMVAVTINKVKDLAKSKTVSDAKSDGGSHAKAVQPLSDAQPETASPQQMNEGRPSRPLHTPDVADVLVAYSTALGYKSWRHPEFGTWFIRCLIYVILNNSCEDHVLDMLTEVAFIISHFKVEYSKSYAVQVPQIVSTLRKRVYFMP